MGGKAAHYHFCYTTIYPFILHPLRLYACIQSSLKRGSVYVKSFDILFSHSSLIAQPQRFPQGVARLSLQRAAELGDNAIRAFKTSLLPYINISSVYWIWPGAKVQRQISFLQLHVSQFLSAGGSFLGEEPLKQGFVSDRNIENRTISFQPNSRQANRAAQPIPALSPSCIYVEKVLCVDS